MDEATSEQKRNIRWVDVSCEICNALIAWDETPHPICNACRGRRALKIMSDVNQWLGKHDGHVEAVKLGQAMRDVRWLLVGLEGGQDDTDAV